MHSLVLELTGKTEPADGLQAKFSAYHGCAAGLTFGRAAEEEFSDEVVRPDMVALRRKVVATVIDSIDEASAGVTAVLHDGRRVHVLIENAIGSLQNPMTTASLEAKFHVLSDALLGAARTTEVIRACRGLGDARRARADRAGESVSRRRIVPGRVALSAPARRAVCGGPCRSGSPARRRA